MKTADVGGGQDSFPKQKRRENQQQQNNHFSIFAGGPKVPVARAQSLQPQPVSVEPEIAVSKLPRVPSAEQLAVEKPLDQSQEKPKDRLPERPGERKRSEPKVEAPAAPIEVDKDLLALAEGSDLMDFLQGGFR